MAVGSYDRSTGQVVDNTGETKEQQQQRQDDAKAGIGSSRNQSNSGYTKVRNSKGQVVEIRKGVIRDKKGRVVFDPRWFEKSNKTNDEKLKQQQSLKMRGSGGRKISIELREQLGFQDNTVTVQRNVRKINQAIQQQEEKKRKEELAIKKKNQQVLDLQKGIDANFALPLPAPQYVGFRQGRPYYSINQQSQVANVRGHQREALRLKQEKLKAENKASEKQIKNIDNTIDFLSDETKQIKKEQSSSFTFDRTTGETSRGKSKVFRPQSQVVGLISGIPTVSKNVENFKSFFGIDKPEQRPTGKQYSVELTESLGITEGRKSEKQTLQERWTPKSYEVGSAQFSDAPLGSDYFGGKQPTDSKKSVEIGGVALKATQPKNKGNRGVAGGLSVLENIYALGSEGATEVSKNIAGKCK